MTFLQTAKIYINGKECKIIKFVSPSNKYACTVHGVNILNPTIKIPSPEIPTFYFE